jgi:hypothetical protein
MIFLLDKKFGELREINKTSIPPFLMGVKDGRF